MDQFYNQDLTTNSLYKTVAVINDPHRVFLMQRTDTNRFYVKKILDVYNKNVLTKLKENPIKGTPKIMEMYEENNELTLIEEYVSGTPLNEVLKGSIKESDFIQYMLDLCDIVSKLHSLKPSVIHRDIKPSNIIITSYNRAVLLDFNAAKFYTDNSQDTVLLGTQGYAAPEQYGFGSSGPQTDIYALGILFKELLNSANNSARKYTKIVEKCTRINQDERYKNILDLKAAIMLSSSDVSLKLNARKTSNNLSIYSFMPPGYRTSTPWKMFIATIVYTFIIAVSFSMTDNNHPSLLEQVYLKFGVLICLLSVVFNSCNYLNIHRLVPLCNHPKLPVKILGIILLDIVVFIALVVVVLSLESWIFN